MQVTFENGMLPQAILTATAGVIIVAAKHKVIDTAPLTCVQVETVFVGIFTFCLLSYLSGMAIARNIQSALNGRKFVVLATAAIAIFSLISLYISSKPNVEVFMNALIPIVLFGGSNCLYAHQRLDWKKNHLKTN